MADLLALDADGRVAATEGKTREYRSFMGVLPAIPFEVVQP